jgi:hypothetical protein
MMRIHSRNLLAVGVKNALLAAVLAVTVVGSPVRAEAPADAVALDRKLLVEARKGSEILANLTYLSDVIGPRLTGSAALQRASAWAANRMKAYGLVHVHQEAWTMPEGWQRGTATGRILEPDNGRALSLSSMGWHPGTNGTVQGDVVILEAKKSADLAVWKGKLKGAIVLDGAPRSLIALADADKPGARPGTGVATERGPRVTPEEAAAFVRERREFLHREGVVAVLVDAGKHHGLLVTTGGWTGTDRPSASNRLPSLFVAHEHYALLYRLARRAAPARTRVELEVSNKFVPGPLVVHNTLGEIRGKEKPDEFVVIGAHLDSWDLGQGTLDNGTGTAVVLETARLLARCGTAPKRTIRFVLFTGEEQGLHGSKVYVTKHKGELSRTSACIVHDTGTGKVIGLGWFGRPALKPILEAELATLKEVGVTQPHARGFGGSDHVPFDRAGVPGAHCLQEIAGYRFAHHTQADTLEMVREGDLIQGAQVMAVSAMRIANLPKLLPRDKR